MSAASSPSSTTSPVSNHAEQGPPSGRKRALIFIFATLTLNSMGIGIILPVIPSLLDELTPGGIATAATWGGALSVAYALMQFLVGPTLGNLSDGYGRRPVLLISIGMLAIDYLIMALASSLLMLFVGRILAGLSAATFSTASAYIADVSSKEDRAKNFGLIGASFGIGFVFGPAIGGLLGEYGTRAPFFAAAAFSLLNFIYGYFVLPETLPREKRRAFDWRRANPLGAAIRIAKYPSVQILLWALFLFDISHFVYPAIWSYYTQAAFGWGPFENGLSLATVGIGFAIVQGFLIRFLEPKLGPMRTLYVGLGANLVAFSLLAIINQGWMVYAGLPFAALGALATPAFTALLANQMDDDAQGELQGIIASFTAIAMVLCPLVMTQVFAYFTSPDAPVFMPGSPFALSAILILLSLVLTVAGLRRMKRDKEEANVQRDD